MDIPVLTSANTRAGAISVADSVFAAPFNEALVHQVVTAGLAAARSGTSAQKSRSGTRGGGRKPWRQKGTGRARAGTVRSPLWRGGGVTFAARKRDYSQKVNRKMYRGAMRAVLSELLRRQRLICIESLVLQEARTVLAVQALRKLDAEQALIVITAPDETLFLAVRNLPGVDVELAGAVTPLRLLQFAKVLCTREALEQIEGVLR